VNELPEQNQNINSNNVANDFAALQNSFTQQGGYARNQDQGRGQIQTQLAGPATTRRWTWLYCWFPTSLGVFLAATPRIVGVFEKFLGLSTDHDDVLRSIPILVPLRLTLNNDRAVARPTARNEPAHGQGGFLLGSAQASVAGCTKAGVCVRIRACLTWRQFRFTSERAVRVSFPFPFVC
jgi:hypothetical protein